MDVRAAERFFENELIREAYAGRERELAVIRERGYAVDVFGRKITTGANGYGPADDLDYSRSILAQLNQARELWLLEPVIGLAEAEQAKARPAFRLVLWQHDGFSVKYRSDAERERWEPRILAGVAERAERHGYPTRLEVADQRPRSRPLDGIGHHAMPRPGSSATCSNTSPVSG